jgi:hypothetical protein
MKMPEEEVELYLRPRPVEKVSIEIPKDTLEALKKVAGHRDMSCEALLRFYIGQGLRHDLAHQYAARVLETTAEVLARHLASDEEVSAIIREIRVEAAG